MMVQSPKSLCPTNSSLLLTPIFQQIVPLQCPRPCPSILFKSGHKKLKLDDSIALSDGFCFSLTCAESSEEERGGGGGSPSRRSRQKDLDEAEGGAVASGAASSSPLQEEEEQQQPPPLRRGRGGRRRGGAPSEGRHPVFRGVRMRQWGRWVSEIRVPGKKSRIWLGTFPAPEMAARAYDTAAFNLKRSYAYLNFPESASSLPLLSPSSTAKQIQEAAAAAAVAFASITLPAGEGGGHVRTSQQQDPAASSAPPPAESSTSMCTSESMQEQELSISPQTASSYIDEDIMFDMPNVLTDMAEGLMITPPLLNHGNLNGSNGDNDVEAPSLWDH